ncbi:MAG: imidazolonepropionase [Planctomycetota bacterium]
MAQEVDALYRHVKELVTLADGPAAGGVRGADLAKAEVHRDQAIAVLDGKVLETGPDAELAERYECPSHVDLDGYVVVPAFCDGHTHPAFGVTREHEFLLRCRGADYVEIARAGGGILSSVESLRGLDEDALVQLVFERYLRFLALGTTTLEAKSGYGLSLDDELRSLRALRRAAAMLPITVSTTFLGAHEVAPEFRDAPGAYVDLLIEEMLPAARPLADSCDVFVEAHVFDLDQGRRILGAARELGYRLRVHVDEIEPLGGTEMAVELGAASVDHLIRISDEGIAALAGSDTTATLLPGTSFFLRKPYAPGRRLADAGALVALATDFNPGSCFTQSLPMIATLARLNYGFSPAECLNAMTRNAAASLGLSEDRGTLHPGKRADFAVLDLPSFEALGYAFGDNPVLLTVVGGRPVAMNSSNVPEGLAAQFAAEE